MNIALRMVAAMLGSVGCWVTMTQIANAQVAPISRCTAADGSYSYVTRGPCRSSSDIRTQAQVVAPVPQSKSILRNPSSTVDASAATTICRPHVETDQGPMRAGTGFILNRKRSENQAFLVTALHIFGPNGGLATQIEGKTLPDHVRGGQCDWIADGEKRKALRLGLPESLGMAAVNGQSNRDIAVFRVPPLDGVGLAMVDQAPKVGDPVWLVAQVVSGAPSTQYLHKAKVIGEDRSGLYFVYDNAGIDLRATSGAPVVNAEGKVVGVNQGGFRHPQKGLVGIAVGKDGMDAVIGSVR